MHENSRKHNKKVVIDGKYSRRRKRRKLIGRKYADKGVGSVEY
jgi:hypothetical protein